MVNKVPSPSGGDDNIEDRLSRITFRLENAASNIQDLVDQLRLSFQESEDDFEVEEQSRHDRGIPNHEFDFGRSGATGPSGASGSGSKDGGASGSGATGTNPYRPSK